MKDSGVYLGGGEKEGNALASGRIDVTPGSATGLGHPCDTVNLSFFLMRNGEKTDLQGYLRVPSEQSARYKGGAEIGASLSPLTHHPTPSSH